MEDEPEHGGGSSGLGVGEGEGEGGIGRRRRGGAVGGEAAIGQALHLDLSSAKSVEEAREEVVILSYVMYGHV